MPYLVLIAFVPGIMLLAPLSVFLSDDMESAKILRATLFLSGVFYLCLIVGGFPAPLSMFIGASGMAITIMISHKVRNAL